MSELVKDKEIISAGRRDPLKDVDAPLRDQVVQKLYDKLVEDEVGERLVSVWLKGNANRTAWLERQEAYLASWDEHLLNDTNGPFKGSSNLHLPVTFVVVKTMHARFISALLGSDSPFNVKARNEASTDRVDTVADTMRYAVLDWANYNKGIESSVDKWIWNWIANGSGAMKWRWDCKYERFVDVIESVAPDAPTIVTDPTGKEHAIPKFKKVEKEAVVTKKTFEGPVLENINHEDMLIIGGGGDPDLADVVQHRQYLTASEIWTYVDRKIFNEAAATKAIEYGESLQVNDITGSIKLQKAMNAGKSNVDHDEDLDRYEIIECYFQYDVDGSGINTEVVAWVHKQTRAILRATYLRRISKSGERPFIKADFHLRNEQEYGTGLVELMYPLAREMDAIHNMRIDFGLISVMPFGFYRATSGIDPETISLEPGALIPVDNPESDVVFPNLGNRTVFGMQEEQAIQSQIERLTSITDMNMGMLAGQGAARTATGARAIVGESSSNLDVHLRRLNRGWKKCLRYLLHTLQQRCPDGLSFRLTGDDGQDYWTDVKNTDDLSGDFDIEVSPNSDTSNPSIQQDRAQQILQITANPLDIQMGLINSNNRYEALRNMMRSMGVKDYGRYITCPDPNFQYNRLTPEEEANRILHGIDIPVQPHMDHQGFIDFVKHIHEDDSLLGQFTPQQTIKLEVQARKHMQALQALQAAQAQQANAQQMQMNAAMSQQQAPVGMNPMQRPAPGAMPGAAAPAPGGPVGPQA